MSEIVESGSITVLEVGTPGPEGPQGPPGATGPKGDQGPPGIDAGVNLTTVTANYTALADDSVILANANSANVTITLPTAVSKKGKSYTVKKIDSSANTVTLAPNGSQSIDGSASAIIYVQNAAITIISDDANWRVI